MSMNALRDAAEQKLLAVPEFAAVTGGSLRTEIEVPAGGLAVRLYARRGVLSAKGDANAGVPEFDRVVTLAIDLIRAGNDKDVERDVVLDADRVLDTLLRDPDFLKEIEGVPSVSVDLDPRQQSDAYTIDARIEIEIADTAVFEPAVTDDLNAVHVTTIGETPKPAALIDNLQN